MQASSVAVRRLHVAARLCARRTQGATVYSHTHLSPPSPEAAAAIIEARRLIFGIVENPSSLRSGRKVLRSRLAGPHVRAYYPSAIADFGLEAVGLENPVREELYRQEQQDNRVGKTRLKGKMRPPSDAFIRRMKVIDAEESMIDQVDYFYPEDVLPDERIVEALKDGLDKDGQEVLAQIFSEVAAMAEEKRLERDDEAADTSNEKAARARDKAKLRRSLSDKRMKEDDNYEGGEERAGAAKAGDAKQFEELKELREAAKESGIELEDEQPAAPAEAQAAAETPAAEPSAAPAAAPTAGSSEDAKPKA